MSYKILVVDDEKDLRELIRLFLNKEGYEAEVAGSGREAFVKVQSWHPNLVISDIRMPNGDGYSLIEDISNVRPGDLPVLIMSGHISTEVDLLRKNPNFVGLMTKPVSWRDLIETVRDIEENSRS